MTKGEAEQALLDRMLAEQPQVFAPDRLWIMDRNFPGVPRIAALLATGSHVLVRVKSDIRLPRIGPFAADGSYLTRLSGGGTSRDHAGRRVPRQRGRADHTRAVGSDRGALPGSLLVGFPGPPAAPGVRLSPHRALHVSCQWVSRWRRLLGPVSMGSGSCCRGSGSG